MSNVPNDYEEMRAAMVNDLTTKLFGPLNPADTGSIRLNPLQLYATGVLFPQRVPIAELDDAATTYDESAPLVDGDGDGGTGAVQRHGCPQREGQGARGDPAARPG